MSQQKCGIPEACICGQCNPEKTEECQACIGFDGEHTCEGWDDFQAMKRNKEDMVPRLLLTDARNEVRRKAIRIQKLEIALNDLLNDCINFDDGKLTGIFMKEAAEVLRAGGTVVSISPVKDHQN